MLRLNFKKLGRTERMPTAKKLTEDRGQIYGHPLDDFTDVSQMIEIVDKCKDPAVRHALRAMCIKIRRLVETPDHQDSIDDIGGYAECINMIHEERRNREDHKTDVLDARPCYYVKLDGADATCAYCAQLWESRAAFDCRNGRMDAPVITNQLRHHLPTKSTRTLADEMPDRYRKPPTD
jgi:hypothetical protein